MNLTRKSRKIVLIDEVSSFLSVMDEMNTENKSSNNYERVMNNFLKANYTIVPLDQMKVAINTLNSIQLPSEEKLKILNFKPKTLIELNLLIDNVEERLTKNDIDVIMNLFK